MADHCGFGSNCGQRGSGGNDSKPNQSSSSESTAVEGNDTKTEETVSLSLRTLYVSNRNLTFFFVCQFIPMDLDELLNLSAITIEDVAKVVYASSPHIPKNSWTEELILTEIEKSVAKICKSIEHHLTSVGLDQMTRNALVNILARVGGIMVNCSKRKENVENVENLNPERA